MSAKAISSWHVVLLRRHSQPRYLLDMVIMYLYSMVPTNRNTI